MRIQGVITVLGDIQSGRSKTGKEYRKREGVLVYDTSNQQYPKGFDFTIMGKNIDTIPLVHGERVDVEVDFAVSEYNGRYFTHATLWRKYDMGQQMPQQQQYPQQQGNPYGIMGPQTTYTPPAPYGQQGYPQQGYQQPQQPFGAGSFPPPPSGQQSDLDF